jgi:hypothetical protein
MDAIDLANLPLDCIGHVDPQIAAAQDPKAAQEHVPLPRIGYFPGVVK